LKLDGKVILVTGASSGIGRELAKQAAAKGARLGLVARRQDLLDSLVVEIGPERAVAARADVADAGQVRAAVAEVEARFGRLDAVVNNAAVGYFGSIERMPMEDLERLLRVNVMGPIQTIQAALPALKASRGMIVNVSSGLSKRSLPFLSAYAGTKSMLDAMSDGMRLELRKHGIHVLTYCPPEVQTDFAASSIKHELADVKMDERRGASADDVARRILRAMERGSREVVQGASLGWMDFFAPKLVDRIFYKAMVLKYSKD